MTTVLRANYREQGNIVSENKDYSALAEHIPKIDTLCHQLKLPRFSEMVDDTDAESGLPAGEGRWMLAEIALQTLDRVRAYLIEHYPHIGILHNATPDLINELESAVDFAMKADSDTAEFNFTRHNLS